MNRRETFILFLLGVLMVAAALTWQFGPYGLLGFGGGVLVTALITEWKEDDG